MGIIRLKKEHASVFKGLPNYWQASKILVKICVRTQSTTFLRKRSELIEG